MKKLQFAVLFGASLLVSANAMAEKVADPALIAVADKTAPDKIKFDRWMVRVRAVNLRMVDESNPVPALGVPADAIQLSNRFIPELDISYFFTKNIAAELVLSYPQKHNVYVTDSDIGAFKAGTMMHLPPTLMLQYHFWPDSRFRPYLGGGVNYTFFFNKKLTVPPPAQNDMTLETGSLGGALQVGFDVALTKSLYLNFDLKKLYINSTLKSADGTTVNTHVNPNPLAFGVGLGYRF